MMVSEKVPKWTGFFLVIDGIDGSGKSTQIQRLKQCLSTYHIPNYITAEPSKGDIGQLLRKYLKDNSIPAEIDALLFAADRVDHCIREILPHLQQGEIVITDRYRDSSISYQSAQGQKRGINREWVVKLNKFCLEPDLTIILDLNPKISIQRRETQNQINKNQLEKFEQVEFLEMVREGFLSQARKKSRIYRIIDGSQSEEKVFQEILTALKEKNPVKFSW